MAHDDERDDLDRAAILARRQRFIALALSGLAACGDDGNNTSSPMPCLDVAAPTEGDASASMSGPTESDATASMSGPADGDTSASTSTGADTTSTSSGDTGDGETSSTTGGSSSGGTESDTDGDGTTGKPQPCLGVRP